MQLGMDRRRLLAVVLAVVGLIAAGFGLYWLTTRPVTAKVTLQDDDKVLARVGSTEITEYDFDLAVQAGFSRTGREVLEGPARRQLLESLIQARAIALAREAELTPVEKAE